MTHKTVSAALVLAAALILPCCSSSAGQIDEPLQTESVTSEPPTPPSVAMPPPAESGPRPEGTPKADACVAGQAIANRLPGSPPMANGVDQEGSIFCVYANSVDTPSASVLGWYSTAASKTPEEICSTHVHFVEPMSIPWVESHGWIALRGTEPSGDIDVSVSVCTSRGLYTASLSNVENATADDAMQFLETMLD